MSGFSKGPAFHYLFLPPYQPSNGAEEKSNLIGLVNTWEL